MYVATYYYETVYYEYSYGQSKLCDNRSDKYYCYRDNDCFSTVIGVKYIYY